jgi:hypothetical protein
MFPTRSQFKKLPLEYKTKLLIKEFDYIIRATLINNIPNDNYWKILIDLMLFNI